jgi:hypothetical protein
MIANQDKTIRESKWPYTRGQRDLRCLVHNAVIELSAG